MKTPLPHCHHSHQKENRIRNPTYVNQRRQQRDTSEIIYLRGTECHLVWAFLWIRSIFLAIIMTETQWVKNKFRQQIVCWSIFKKHITDWFKALSAFYFFNHHQCVLKEQEWKINPNPAVTQELFSYVTASLFKSRKAGVSKMNYE